MRLKSKCKSQKHIFAFIFNKFHYIALFFSFIFLPVIVKKKKNVCSIFWNHAFSESWWFWPWLLSRCWWVVFAQGLKELRIPIFVGLFYSNQTIIESQKVSPNFLLRQSLPRCQKRAAATPTFTASPSSLS